jgi:DNA-directed RNA polymerase subunit L/DNA-directed RNA polymerase alpha subunit
MSYTLPKFENVAISADNMECRFTLNPYHVSYANTLRRAIITGVESVAFRADMTEKGTTTDVTVHRNNTPMTNEMLADRVGLLPLLVRDPLSFTPERYNFSLNAVNDTMEMMDIKASMIKVTENVENEDEPVGVPNETFFQPDPLTRDTCLIAVLRPKTNPSADNEGIHLVAKASVGTGRQHARYIPVSQCSYEYTRDDNPERIKEFFDKWLVDHKKINPETLKTDSEKLKILQREFNTMAIARCFKINEQNEPYSFDFNMESVGILSIQYIMKRACEVVENMCMQYANIVDGELPEELTVRPTSNRSIGFDFLFRGHDHTLGNLMQTWLVENHFVGEAEPRITYAGYAVPHPLRDEMVLSIGVEDGQESTARQALQAAARACATYFEQTKKAWMETVGLAPAGAGAGARKAAAAAGPGAGAGAKSARKASALVA